MAITHFFASHYLEAISWQEVHDLLAGYTGLLAYGVSSASGACPSITLGRLQVMKKRNNNGKSTPNTPTPEPAKDAGMVSEALVTYDFPRCQDVTPGEPIVYGDRKESLRVSDDELVSIDAYFFASPTNLKLKHIKTALNGLKKQGVKIDGKEVGQKWFNDNVRDPFHKVLRYAARFSLNHGAPVSLAFTKRLNKDTGVITTTAKHGFEFKSEPTQSEKIEEKADKAADKTAKKEKAQSKTRAKRQQGKKNLQPLVSPENVNRVDALVYAAEAEKAAKAAAANAAAPATNGEQK